MSMKNKEARKKRKYSTLGCFAWAMKKLWRLDRRFVFFMFAGIPVAVVTPLVSSYFSKYLIDSIGSGAPFSTLAVIVGVFIAAQFLLRVLDGFIDNQKMSRRYYPTLVFQTDLAEYRFFGADYENTEKQDFQQIQAIAALRLIHDTIPPAAFSADLMSDIIIRHSVQSSNDL